MRYKNRIPVYKQENIIEKALNNKEKVLKQKNENVKNTKIFQILYFIHSNIFHRYISVGEIKDKFNLRTGDVVLFREEVEMGLSSYVQKLKMEASKKLLQKTDLEIYVIAYELFYNHEQSFSRAFKNYFGMSPSQYRENTPPINI
jgi:two-component system response regulator YesN